MPPVLHLPDNRGMFCLSLDTSKTATSSTLWQIQNSVPQLISYAIKRLSSATVHYLITKLELLGLCVNSSQFKHVLAKVDFDCAVDHLVLVYVMKEKLNQLVPELKDC